MKKEYIVGLTTFFVLSSNAIAQNGYQLAQKHLCTSCHSLDRKIIGPPWMSISTMYQSRPDAEAYLIGKIRSGGTGTWGNAQMPPSNTVGEADIKTLAHYIMGLAKE